MLSVRGARLNGSVSSLSKCRCGAGVNKEQQQGKHGVNTTTQQRTHLDHSIIHNVAAPRQPHGFVHEGAHNGVQKLLCAFN